MNLFLEDYSGKPYIMSNVYSFASLSEEEINIRKFNILLDKDGNLDHIQTSYHQWKFQYTYRASEIYGKLSTHLGYFLGGIRNTWRYRDNVYIKIPTKQEIEELACQGVENFW